jgi:spermidine synthase
VFPRYLEATYQGASIEVIEIDPAVTGVAYSQLGLPATSRIVTYNEDARIFFRGLLSKNKYDLVIGDAFNYRSVPYQLTTLEFNKQIKESLQPGGFYVINLIDNVKDGIFVRSFMKTLNLVFKQVYLILPGGVLSDKTTNQVVIATDRGLTPSEFASLIKATSADASALGALVTLDEIEMAFGKKAAVILTDDYAPVDNLLAPLFTDR